MTPEYVPFPKIGRWANNKIAITEKIDGTNGCIAIERRAFLDGTCLANYINELNIGDPSVLHVGIQLADCSILITRAGSRSRWLWPGKTSDNFGFACWVQDNAAELVKLGAGTHYGEFWGSGIQRRYGLTDGDKRFSLFNTGRWVAHPDGGIVYDKTGGSEKNVIVVPGLNVVPQLYYGPMRDASGRCMIEESMRRLQFGGSEAAPGFKDPEGVMVYFEALKSYCKAPFDPLPKGQG